MKKILLAILIVTSIIEMKAQCGPFPFSVFDQTLTCNVTTVSIAIGTTVSPVSCVWANMPGLVSGGNTLNAQINNPGSYSFTLTNTNNGCTTTGTVNVLVNVVFPILSVSVSNSSVCPGTSAILSSTASPSNVTYSWSNGSSMPSITVTPVFTSNYTVTVTDAVSGCSTSALVAVNVSQTCQDVWPGDANSDGLANNLDVLELGLHFTHTGTPRASVSNNWQPYFSNNWLGTISNGKNVHHSDCNGDGIIDNHDTVAIYNNYNLIHAFKTAQTSTVSSQLNIVPDQTVVNKGEWGTASIYLGENTNQINTINGLAYAINFNNTLVETDSIYVEYLTSFLNANNLNFNKRVFSNGVIYTATTHTNNINASGNGKIATLHYKINPNLATDQILNIGLVQANKSDASGTILPLTSGSGTLIAKGTFVGLQEITNDNFVSISPNPTNGLLNLYAKKELQKIEVTSITGNTLLSEIPTGNDYILHLENFSNGVYFINIYENDRIIKREKVIVNR